MISSRHIVARLIVVAAALVALQPGLIDIVSPVVAIAVGWQHLAKNIIPKRFIISLVVLAMTGIGLKFGIAPAFALMVLAVLVSMNSSELAVSARWLAGWVAVLAAMHLPPFVRLMLFATDIVPPWISLVVLPVFFLMVALSCGMVRIIHFFGATLGMLAIGYVFYIAEYSPYILSILVAIPAALTVLFENHERSPKLVQSAGVLLAGVVASFVMLVPVARMPGTLSFWIPEAKSSISRYFENYEAILKISGFQSVRIVNGAADIAPGDWVVLPSAAHPALGDQLLALRKLPHYSTIRIVIFGEHTDVDGVASALQSDGAPIGLNVDTTIPPRNSDFLGWSSGIGAVLSHDIPLNRGASISHLTWSAIPLVWILGGHRETDLYEDGSLGDMVMRKGERTGIYSAMSLAREPGGATWVMIGDSTPALNEFLAAKPSAMAELFALATGLPAVLGVLLWGMLFVAVFHRSRLGTGLLLCTAAAYLLPIPLAKNLLFGIFLDEKKANVVVVDRPTYGDRAVGRALVALSKNLVDSDVMIVVGRGAIDSARKQIVISHPPDWNLRSDCVRAGDIQLSDVRLLDAVVCPSEEKDVSLRVGRDPIAYLRGSYFFVLDQHFIANAAPPANVKWLNKIIYSIKD